MLRWLVVFIAALFFAGAAFAQTVTLRPRIEASGQAVTLGDIFDGAGAVSGRAIAPAPPAGQMSTLSVQLLAAAASAAGLQWAPPAGLNEVRVVRPGGARATLPPSSFGANSVSDAAVRRGQAVIITYVAPGMTLSTQARALEDGAIGQSVRFQNISNRTIDATVTGPGAARVETP
jgi:flagella basal body P-ring formation protein FlgA